MAITNYQELLPLLLLFPRCLGTLTMVISVTLSILKLKLANTFHAKKFISSIINSLLIHLLYHLEIMHLTFQCKKYILCTSAFISLYNLYKLYFSYQVKPNYIFPTNCVIYAPIATPNIPALKIYSWHPPLLNPIKTVGLVHVHAVTQSKWKLLPKCNRLLSLGVVPSEAFSFDIDNLVAELQCDVDLIHSDDLATCPINQPASYTK